jgi:hypothetical protein
MREMIPNSFQPVTLRGITTQDPQGHVGISFDTPQGDIIRVKVSKAELEEFLQLATLKSPDTDHSPVTEIIGQTALARVDVIRPIAVTSDQIIQCGVRSCVPT